MQEILSFLGVPAGLITLYLLIVGIFSAVEKIASKKARADIARYLRTANLPASSRRLQKISFELIDRTFGKKHFSSRTFVASSLFSLVSVVLLVVLAFALDYWEERSFSYLIQYSVYWNYFFLGVLRGGPELAAFILWIVWLLLVNYLNLYKTRVVIGLLAEREFSALGGLGVIVLDFIFGLFLFLFGIGLFVLVLFPMLFGNADVLPIGGLGDRLISIALNEQRYVDLPALILENVLKPLSVTSWFFYVGMLPSMWLWLYMLSALAAKGAVRSARVVRFLRYFVDLKSKPFEVIGHFAGVLVVLGLAGGYGLFKLIT